MKNKNHKKPLQNQAEKGFNTEHLNHHERTLVYKAEQRYPQVRLDFKTEIKPVLIAYAMEYGGILALDAIRIAIVIDRLDWRFYPNFTDFNASLCRSFIAVKQLQKGAKHEK